tara:strand:- start:719 stop:1249 length:531 start_codon:yes stop_codon:yes gene_type:complete
MLLLAETIRKRCIVDKVSEVKEWIKSLSVKREELGGHSVCPYAFSATVLVEERALSNVTLNDDYDVIVYIVEDDISICSMMRAIGELNMRYPDHMILDDHKDEPTYINGIQSNFGKANLILIQRRDKLLKAREDLHKTSYYSFWESELYERITNGKLPNRQKQRIRQLWNDTHHPT